MANPQKQKGALAEREVAAILSDELGYPCRRALGAGRKDDIGDVVGLPGNAVVQVANWASLDRAVREKLPTVETQMKNAGATHGALWCRRRGGHYVVVLTPTQWISLFRDSLPVSTESPMGGIPSDSV